MTIRLTHKGPANPAHVARTTCLQTTLPGVDPLAATGFANTIVASSGGLLDARTYVDHEPSVPAYARPYSH